MSAQASTDRAGICDHCDQPADAGAICTACAWKDPDPDREVERWKEDSRGPDAR